MTLTVRAGAGGDAMNEIRREIAAIDPNLTVFNARTMAEFRDQSNSLLRWTSYVYGGFGVFGLVLACVGLAGVTAYSVMQRRKEIGIRMALGATRVDVMRLVLKYGLTLAAAGLVLGLIGSVALTRLLVTLLYGVSPTDPVTLGAMGALLVGVAMLACYLPARRATRVDPMVALRYE